MLTAEAAVEGSWAARCRSGVLDAVAEGGSMFHVFTVPARGMVTIALDAAGEAELVLRRGEAREGAALEEDAARIRLPLDAGAYTVEVADRAGAGGAYTLTLGLVEPPAMSYLTFDASGETVTAGSYAILTGEPGARRIVTTYEELRTEASAVRFHLADAGGTSHADFLATVEVGDVFEWRQADDCWTRYQVTSLPAPSDGASHVEFGVRWVTYAYSGCSGPLPATLPGALGWHPGDVGGVGLASPVRHGAHHLAPAGWTGLIEPRGTYPPPSVLAYQAAHETTKWPLPNPKPITTTDIAEARTFPEWREPTLPTGWTLFKAETDTLTAMPDGYCADYLNERGYMGAMICVGYKVHRPEHYASTFVGAVVRETAHGRWTHCSCLIQSTRSRA